ncbi:MAG TPA: BTAD domain-containing putative transcriptional regulator [Gemmatimonadaceae bacterium]|nr:BTAD domain-containing putative transcriptional regulator [Gemmatimonadaceae bacterium]
MTVTPEKQDPSRRHHLRTFGTLSLTGPGEPAVINRGPQRRRLALLAVLAAAGDRGRSRDELLLLFWPDATQARARHSLEQLMYAIRGSVDKDVFTGVNPVRLNRDAVTTDVADFNEALERGDAEAAVESYRGPFLDGFYLADAPEFEQWTATERAQLQRGYSGALERLAESAEAAGDDDAAVRWWRKLTETDPVSARSASGLIRALMNAGDHAAALQHAELYEGIVARELGTSVGPAVADLVAEVRAKSKTQPVGAFKSPPPAARPNVGIPSPRGANRAAPDALTGASLQSEWDPTQAQPQSQPRRPARRSPIWYVVGGVALFAFAAAAVWMRGDRRDNSKALAAAAPAATPSIAVLPFANVSGNQQDVAFSDGLSEDLIAALAKIPKLRVIARTSALAFKNSQAGARSIADSLGVSNILEGSVQRSGPRLRVQVRLVDARDGSTRWSETYNREVKDIFAVQSEIAGAVARELDLRLSETALVRIRRGSTANIAAYDLYLRGSDPILMRSDSGAYVAIEYLRQAIALDPGYAAAYAGFARANMRTTVSQETARTRKERFALAEQAAEKAVSLDDSLAEARATLGLMRRRNYDLAAAEAEMKRAIALEPATARFHEWLAQIYLSRERPAEALVEARRALELDPLSPTASAEVANSLLANNRCDEAFPIIAKLKVLRPPLQRTGAIATQCYISKQLWPDAIAEARGSSASMGPSGQAVLGYTLARAGRTDEARQILDGLVDRSRRISGGAFDVAVVYAGLGDKDQAFAWLNRAVDDRSLRFEWYHIVLGGLRDDPRYALFRARFEPGKR